MHDVVLINEPHIVNVREDDKHVQVPANDVSYVVAVIVEVCLLITEIFVMVGSETAVPSLVSSSTKDDSVQIVDNVHRIIAVVVTHLVANYKIVVENNVSFVKEVAFVVAVDYSDTITVQGTMLHGMGHDNQSSTSYSGTINTGGNKGKGVTN